MERNSTHDHSDDAQFNFEVDQLPKLVHPNIIKVLAYSNDVAEHPCMIYQYMEHGTLSQRLAPGDWAAKELQADQRIKIALGIADAIKYLHTKPGKPLIHRDIKTTNILLAEDWSPMLADFGLLRAASTNNTITTNIKGTPRYMAPEAFRGTVDVKTDMYSFGVVLLEILTGLPSFMRDADGDSTDIVSATYNCQFLVQH